MTEYAVRGTKDLKSIKDLKGVQDGPPPGGFPAVRYARRIPNTGPSGVALVIASTGIIAYGFYQIGQGNLKRRYEGRCGRVLKLAAFHVHQRLRFPLQYSISGFRSPAFK